MTDGFSCCDPPFFYIIMSYAGEYNFCQVRLPFRAHGVKIQGTLYCSGFIQIYVCSV